MLAKNLKEDLRLSFGFSELCDGVLGKCYLFEGNQINITPTSIRGLYDYHATCVVIIVMMNSRHKIIATSCI